MKVVTDFASGFMFGNGGGGAPDEGGVALFEACDNFFHVVTVFFQGGGEGAIDLVTVALDF